jgi:hypothetical protein
MGQPYHAKDAIVYLAGTSSDEASELLGCSEWTLDMSTDTVEVTAFGDTNKTYVQGLPDVSGSLTVFWRDDENKLFTAQAQSSPVKCYLYFSRNATTRYAYGKAWLSTSLNSAVSGAVSLSANFVAGGPWTVKTS